MNSPISRQNENQAHGPFRTLLIQFALCVVQLGLHIQCKCNCVVEAPYYTKSLFVFPGLRWSTFCVINYPGNSIDLQKTAGFQLLLTLQSRKHTEKMKVNSFCFTEKFAAWILTQISS